MRTLFHLLIFSIPFSLSAQTSSDSTKIVQLLIKDYKTLAHWDIESHLNNCTDDYYLIENGQLWTSEDEQAYFEANHHRLIRRRDRFKITYSSINGNSAYLIYELTTSFSENGKYETRHWIEDAHFKKINGEWKISLIHSSEWRGEE